MEILAFVIWMVLVFAVADAGNKKTIGYWGAFAISLIFSPVVGIIVVLCSSEKKEVTVSDELSKMAKLYDQGYITQEQYKEVEARLKHELTEGEKTERINKIVDGLK